MSTNAIIGLGICAACTVATVVTKDAICLLGLFFLLGVMTGNEAWKNNNKPNNDE